VPHCGAGEVNRSNSAEINGLREVGNCDWIAAFDETRRLCDHESGNRPRFHRAAAEQGTRISDWLHEGRRISDAGGVPEPLRHRDQNVSPSSPQFEKK